MKHPYYNLDLILLSDQEGAAELDKQFVMIDNLKQPSSHHADEEEEADGSKDFFVNYPVKLSFTMAIFCVAGSIRFRINLKEHELRANHLLVVMQGDIGEFLGMSCDAQMAVIAFGGEYFKGTTMVEETMLLEQRLRSSPLCHLPESGMKECLAIYQLAKNKIAETDNPFRQSALMGYAQVLTSNAYYYINEEQKKMGELQQNGRQYELYARFMAAVQQHYTRERSIKYYADCLCVTPKYLSQMVHRVSGRFASEWITDFVMLEAKALLMSRRHTIQQISDMLNFANQSFFGRYFKDNTGKSPTEYVKSLSKTADK